MNKRLCGLWLISCLLCMFCLPAWADCIIGTDTTFQDGAQQETMVINFGSVGYTVPTASGTVLATAYGTSATSSDGTATTFYCHYNSVNNDVTVEGQWSGNAGAQVGYYQLAPGLYLRLTFSAKNLVYPFSNVNMRDSRNSSTPISLRQQADLVYINDGSGLPRLPTGFAQQEVAFFAEPNCINNPYDYYYDGYNLSCMNVRVNVSITQLMPKYSCSASLPSTVNLGSVRADKLAGKELPITNFTATLNCDIPPLATIEFDGPSGSSGTNFANTGTASPVNLSLQYAGQRISTGTPISLPTNSASSSFNFNVSLISPSNKLTAGSVNVPVNWIINYQ